MDADMERGTVPTSQQWVRLCDDFVNLEGRCAILCELLIGLSRRDNPLEPAGKHGVELFASQLREQLAIVKQQLYQVMPE